MGIHGKEKPRSRYDLSTGADLANPSGLAAERPGGKSIGKGVRLLVGVMSLLAGGMFLGFGGWYAVRDVALSGDRPTADATVLKIQISRGPGIASVEVDFVTADGRHVRVTVQELADPVPGVGGILRVRYDPAHPSWFARDVRRGPSLFEPVLSAFAVLLAAFAFVFVAIRGGGNAPIHGPGVQRGEDDVQRRGGT